MPQRAELVPTITTVPHDDATTPTVNRRIWRRTRLAQSVDQKIVHQAVEVVGRVEIITIGIITVPKVVAGAHDPHRVRIDSSEQHGAVHRAVLPLVDRRPVAERHVGPPRPQMIVCATTNGAVFRVRAICIHAPENPAVGRGTAPT